MLSYFRWTMSLPAAVLCILPLAAPLAASATPDDFEGTWRRVGAHDTTDFILGLDLPYKPEGQNLAADHLQWFKEGRSKASAHLMCRPTGIQGMTAPKETVLILQTSRKMYVLSQEDREVRHIYLNREHPAHPTPTYSGDSVARWEGRTLVVDTIGFNDKGQLDEIGNPQSNQMHVVERWTKSDDGSLLTVEYTFSDPVYYTQPFKKVRQFRRAPGARLADYDCGENPRTDDFENLTFENDWFKPTCARRVVDGIAGETVVCTPQTSR